MAYFGNRVAEAAVIRETQQEGGRLVAIGGVVPDLGASVLLVITSGSLEIEGNFSKRKSLQSSNCRLFVA